MKKYHDNVDFSECRFIEDQMQFYTFDEFCDNCEAIRRLYENLSSNGKIFYHYYIYAHTHIKLNYKNAIKDFLSGYDDEKKELLELKKQYKVR